MLYELGIKDPKHRKKISLRAMDIVLFGPPIGEQVKFFVPFSWQI